MPEHRGVRKKYELIVSCLRKSSLGKINSLAEFVLPASLWDWISSIDVCFGFYSFLLLFIVLLFLSGFSNTKFDVSRSQYFSVR